ncbi:MAG: hypothetical protein Sylvanvirus22_7 [Sylvanvirus sp.]|uniref:DDE Tnp4 domain-containing protein n=1 Tax=Sylvanvirus sp. TaxID=2487774 RepID=A0A3G5AIU1_9VIRU|nr:MAG: hypothetical protein Sylvanvirus22_7 [Sylvanvirus sp.]
MSLDHPTGSHPSVDLSAPLRLDVSHEISSRANNAIHNGDSDIQNAYYNGWKHDTFVSNVLVFMPDGTIAFAVINHPGSHHDVTVARPLMDLLEYHTPPRFYILGDTAFQYQSNKLVTPYKRNQFSADAIIRARQLIQHQERTSARQTVEWGNGQLQASFPRLRVELRGSDWEYNGNLIQLCLHLFNLKVRRMNIFNQVSYVFNSRP